MFRARPVALALTVFTGVAGLVYQVAWQRYLATLLGSHSEATATVLAIFLAGMSLGYAAFGRVSERVVRSGGGARARLLFVYGAVEAGIGFFAWAFPFYFDAVRSLSSGLPPGTTGAGFALDVVLAALLIGPPAALMGATVPLLTQALSRDLEDATRLHARVYALNTVGAFGGALLGGFALVPWLGLGRVMFAMGAINLLAGAAFVALSRGEVAGEPLAPAEPVERAERSAGAIPDAPLASYALVAVLVGFAMMAFQTILNRLGALAFGSSQFTFATVVALNVSCIAIGSLAVTRWKHVPERALATNQWLLFASAFLLYFVLDQLPYWAHVLRIQFGASDADFHAYHASALLAMLLVLGPPIVFSGAVLPLLFHALRERTGELGSVAGRIYAWNTLGSLLGALLGGYALLFVLDLHHVYRIALLALALAAMGVARSEAGGALATPRLAAIALIVVGALATAPAWSPRLLSIGLFRVPGPLEHSYAGPGEAERIGFMGAGGDLVFHDDDPTLTAAVLERRESDLSTSRSILNNGKNDSSTHVDYPTAGLGGVLPALLVDEPERAFVIGYGTGVTVGELAQARSMQRVVVAEISQAVIEAAPLFDEWNFAASRDPKVEIVRSDAYRALLRDDARYDVIVSEPSNPWVTGVEMLYAREFLQAARARLAPGGVYVQWMHLYETDDASVELVLRTYRDVFDRVAVWFGLGDDLLLVGFDDAAAGYEFAALRAKAGRPPFAAALRRCGIDSFLELAAHELLPPGALAELELEGPLHTLDHPRLASLAARAFFRADRGDLPFFGTRSVVEHIAPRALLRQWVEHEGPLDDRGYGEVVAEACSHRRSLCTALLADWYRAFPSSRAREELVAATLRPTFIFHGAEQGNPFREVAELLRRGPSSGAIAHEEALRLWRAYYHPHVAFDPDRLDGAVPR